MVIVNVWRDMEAALCRLEEADLLRRPAVVESACPPRASPASGTPRVVIGGREVICLCSNDYLNLAADPAVCAAAAEGIRQWGVGAGASRLVSGTTAEHVELEERLADFEGVESAIVTTTGWMANRVAVCSLAGRGDLILCDKLNHASILDAAAASGARMRTFPHRDVDRAGRLLQRHRGRHRRCLIATDSLFSMDGDLAPLGALVELKRQFNAQLLIDEAHATGVMGESGRGAAELLGVESDVDAVVGTLSKAFGALGGFVTGPRVLIETIRNTGRAFIYTTALPAAICRAASSALKIIQDQPHRRRQLLATADWLRGRLRAAGLDVGDSASQIIPVAIAPAGLALRVSRRLLEEGFFVPAVRPPTVARGKSRLRISLSAAHDRADLDRFVEALAKILEAREP